MTAPATDAQRPTKRPARASTDRAAWSPPREAWLPVCGVALLFAGHWFYGGLVNDVAMLLGLAAAVLVGVALLRPEVRDDLLRLRGLEAPAILFGLTILVALWTLTPWTPGGPHPVWAYVGVRPGASTIDKSSTIMEIIKLLGLGCFFLVGAATGARDDRARFALQLTLGLGVAFGFWAFIGSVTGTVYQTQEHRLEGHFLNPNTAGTFFAVLLMLAIPELGGPLKRRRSEKELTAIITSAAVVLTFAICLLDTVSRGAMLAFTGGVLVYMAVQLATGGMKPTRLVLTALVGLTVLLLLILVAGDALIARFFAAQQDADVRTAIWKAHWGAFLESPLFGYGLGTAETVNKTLVTVQNYEVLRPIRSILNVYLEWLENAGIIGAAPMFLCIGALIFATFRKTLRRSRMVRALAGLLAVDAIFLIHGATDFGLEVTSIAALWSWLLGLQFSLAQGSSRR
jgi:O-antigen ligase